MCIWAKWFAPTGCLKKRWFSRKKRAGSKKSICFFAQIKKLMMSLSFTLVRRPMLGWTRIRIGRIRAVRCIAAGGGHFET